MRIVCIPLTLSLPNISVGPLDVQLLGRKEPVSAGRSYEFRCQSVGARPPPIITWWRGSIQLRENITNRVGFAILFFFTSRNKLSTNI